KDIHKKQMFWAIFALIAMLVAIAIPNKVFYGFSYLLYGICILSLLWVPAIGTKGRWVNLGPVSVQPSELAKIAVVFALGRYLSGKKRVSPRHAVVPVIIILIPMLLVAKQPNLGTSLVYGAVLIPMLYWAGFKPLHLFLIFSPLFSIVSGFWWVSWLTFIIALAVVLYLVRPRLVAAAGLVIINLIFGILTPVLWGSLHTYQQQRIIGFLSPGRDPLGSGYQIIQSKVAIGSGGFLGKGFLGGTQTKLAFLPRQHTDFIFSVIGEELGFIGSTLVLSLFLFLLYRGIAIAASAKNRFASLISIGLVSILGFHVFVNVGMTVGMLPVTGLPLPFLSYGGSSLVTNMTLVGLLLNVGLRRHEY
ncbi:MAG TPA: rod shape-determining protein RodA, partial [Candidatus Latescibacteria bacterium]|nr:rod shape-determining protein RodA [Candidatus Latescibacterota bacterium]